MPNFIYMYDVVPGLGEEAAAWARTRWIPFWTSQPAVISYQVSGNMFGAFPGPGVGFPQRVVTIETETMSDLLAILRSDEAVELLKELHRYAINVQTYCLETIYRYDRSDGTQTSSLNQN